MAALLTCLLCALIIIKPQEIIPALDAVPLLQAVYALTFYFIALDLLRMRIRPAMAPQIPFFFAYLGWALVVTLFRSSDAFTTMLGSFVILSAVFLTVVIALSATERIRAFAWTYLACALLVISVAISQERSPLECHLGEPDDWAGRGTFIPDGRPCETARDCREDTSGLNDNYICERAGLFHTRTIDGRVRYRGELEDPNEVSLMVSSALPFGLALTERRKRRSTGIADPLSAAGDKFFQLVSLALIGLVGFTVVITRSRTGLIAFLVVTSIYFIRRVGAWGVVAACAVVPPMLLFGGRSGDGADGSTQERTELILEAFSLIRESKGIGVGAGQFIDASSISMTAHNTYLLAAAETGIVGLLLFGTLLYVSIKVPLALWFGNYRISAATTRMASALAICLCGVAGGIIFLSWAYKNILYMLIALSCALYAVAKAEDPQVNVRLSPKEYALIPVGTAVLLVVMYVGARLRM